ncbi:hypothetical protein [Streptomyces sp. R41]|uniref:Uncharacterized protein n=1 Tax=Streptomyces sp. R41 TaxID=3238632 RepID=A0AB39REU9_9ACTN
MSTGEPAPTGEPTPTGEPAPSTSWTREQWLALVGVLLALAALLVGVIVWLFGDDQNGQKEEKSAQKAFVSYREASDAACAKYGPALAELGDGPWQGDPVAYAAHLREKNEVLGAVVRDWQALVVPDYKDMREKVAEAQSLALGSIRQYEIAADVMEDGGEDANPYIAEGGRVGMESITKSRAIGFNICPGGR